MMKKLWLKRKKKKEKMKLADLAFLKQQLSDHPFTSKGEVILYCNLEKDEKQ